MVKFDKAGQGYFDFNAMTDEEVKSALHVVNLDRDTIRIDVDAKRNLFGIQSQQYEDSLSYYNEQWATLSFKKYLLCKELVDRGYNEFYNVFKEIEGAIND